MGRMNIDRRVAATGFTLIEVVIATIIVTFLVAIAWPSYAGYVMRSKRAEAIAVLAETMLQQERLYARRNSYLAFSRDDNPEGLKWHSAATSSESSHEISARPCEGESLSACVELVAVPGAAAVDSRYRDISCGTLILDSRGGRSPADPACWR